MKTVKQAVMAALLVAIAIPVAAQQPQPQPPTPAPGAGLGARMLNVELALRQKEQLKLNDSQVSQLEAIRKEVVAERQERSRQMIDLQSRIAAGLLKPEDARAQFQAGRDENQKAMQARRDRVGKILTQEQQEQLVRFERRSMIQRARLQRGGQRFGPGFGSARGLRRGHGPGFGPGFGPQFGPGFNRGFGRGFGPARPLPPAPPRAPGK